jgi:hypothetical protein
MNRLPLALRSPGAVQIVRFPEFDVSWAGPNPYGGGFCFGSENGRLLYTDEQGVPLGNPALSSASEEAINGVAGSRDWLAVTTRAEVNFIGPVGKSGRPLGVLLPSGAHGVTVSPGGYFVAPLGRSGIMFVKTGSRPEDPVTGIATDKEGVYFYRVIALKGAAGQDIIVCAARFGGVGVTQFRGGVQKFTLSTVKFDNLDVVDVCSIANDQNSMAVAALGKDGTLILIRDIVNDQTPVSLRFDSIHGTAYRLLSCRGHIFVVTSHGLYGLFHLASSFLDQSLRSRPPTPVLSVPSEAVDANLVSDRWLLVVVPDEVLKFDLMIIEKEAPEFIESGEIPAYPAASLSLRWHMDSREQSATAVMAGAH